MIWKDDQDEMSLNVNTANNVDLGGSIDFISESGWMGMLTCLNDVTHFLQHRRGIETGWNMDSSSEHILQQQARADVQSPNAILWSFKAFESFLRSSEISLYTFSCINRLEKVHTDFSLLVLRSNNFEMFAFMLFHPIKRSLILLRQ